MPNTLRAPLLAAAFALSASPALAEPATVHYFTEMFTEGKASLDFRYRFEFVDQDGFDEDAEASTLRSRLTFATASFHGFTGLLEFDDLSDIGSDDYNSTANGNPT